MSNSTLIPIDGIIQNISTPTDDCCQQQVTIRNSQGVYNFMVDADTYIVGSIRLRPGMTVAAFYDGNVAVPLVYPPQYQAVIISRRSPGRTSTPDISRRIWSQKTSPWRSTSAPPRKSSPPTARPSTAIPAAIC